MRSGRCTGGASRSTTGRRATSSRGAETRRRVVRALTLKFSCGRSAYQAHHRLMRVSVSRRSTATLGAPVSCNATLARSLSEGCRRATQRERARSTEKPRVDPVRRPSGDPTPLSGSLARRATQRLARDGWAAGRMAGWPRPSKASMGRRTSDIDGTTEHAWRPALSTATSFHSLFAR